MSSQTRRPTAAILTQGCKVNQYESEAIAEALAACGFTLCQPQDVCDVYIVNTCTVTSESDRKARQAIRRLLSENPEAYLIVTGCSAQSHAQAISAIPGVDCIIGNRNKMEVVEAARRLLAGGSKPKAPLLSVPSLDGCRFEPMTITRFDRTRAYVKIQDGCQARCTYCAIPDARGPVRSKPLADVLREVTTLTQGGCREVVLTGIETGSWGYDLPAGEDGVRPGLGDLLRAVNDIPGIGRIRLGSLDPSVMNRRFVDTIAPLSCLAPHFHLSVQSGCSATLARMKRRYNAGQAMAAMDRLRAAIPGVHFTTDMIVGFPGETEAEFEESLDFARRAGFLHIHVFPYSKRENTPAALMPDQVPEAVKHERVRRMSRVSAASCAAILDGIVEAGAPVSVLCESREGDSVFGHTPDFVEVRIPTGEDLRGREITVTPTAREGEVLVCRLPAQDPAC
ncbi:MAG: tRNA (N(6)-L-threonylcarbamoyladenosine(37)-C(2))-methylthiotransferase MtaB [Eubacteriales bacterium]